jgi:RecA/RadA recombinase
MSSSLRERLLKNSTIELTAMLEESKVFGHKEAIQTPVPMVNVALSGRVDGGLTAGLTVLAGPSKHFKTAFGLLLVSSFLKKNPDGMVLFYDSEFGTPMSYFDAFEVNKSNIVHSPITDIEMLKFDVMAQLDGLKRGDKVMILVDSIGNLASKKEVEDALNQKGAADMTRAKQLKSLFRMVTPHLSIKDFPMVIINHTYATMDMYPTQVMSGGTGPMLSADNVWIISRRQEKDDKELLGYHFVINVEKSRYLKEKSKIPITVSFEGGINRWSGLLDLALEGGFIIKPKNGWYARVDLETGEVMTPSKRVGDIIDNSTFWKAVFEETNFKEWIEERYVLASGPIMSAEEPTVSPDQEDES